MDSLYKILILFTFFLPLCLFSFVTYKMRDEIFAAFRPFALWWIPLTISLILLAPVSDSGLIPIDKGRVSFGMNILFLRISLIIIAYKFFTLKKSKSGK